MKNPQEYVTIRKEDLEKIIYVAKKENCETPGEVQSALEMLVTNGYSAYQSTLDFFNVHFDHSNNF